jgi:Ulp1 family protease
MVIPLDSLVPSLDPLCTSRLPSLITDSWLSDEHINAGCDFVNHHPHCPSNLRVLHSFFLGSLQSRSRRRQSAAPMGHARALDTPIAHGTVNELLIPVHRPSHWALLYLDLITRCYVYVDSLSPESNAVPWSSINPINEWLSEVFNRDVVLAPGSRPFILGAQSDSHSCGVAVLSSMAYYALGGDFLPWFQHSAKEHRLRWALALFAPDKEMVCV